MVKLNKSQISEIKNVMQNVSQQTEGIEDIIFQIADKATVDLDLILKRYEGWLRDNPTDAELEEVALQTTTLLYYAGELMERVGLSEDVAKGIKMDVYNAHYDKDATGTIADKKASAELASQTESLTHQIYARAYKMIKYKVEKTEEMLNVVKKIISKRAEMSANGSYVYNNKKRERGGRK